MSKKQYALGHRNGYNQALADLKANFPQPKPDIKQYKESQKK